MGATPVFGDAEVSASLFPRDTLADGVLANFITSALRIALNRAFQGLATPNTAFSINNAGNAFGLTGAFVRPWIAISRAAGVTKCAVRPVLVAALRTTATSLRLTHFRRAAVAICTTLTVEALVATEHATTGADTGVRGIAVPATGAISVSPA